MGSGGDALPIFDLDSNPKTGTAANRRRFTRPSAQQFIWGSCPCFRISQLQSSKTGWPWSDNSCKLVAANNARLFLSGHASSVADRPALCKDLESNRLGHHHTSAAEAADERSKAMFRLEKGGRGGAGALQLTDLSHIPHPTTTTGEGWRAVLTATRMSRPGRPGAQRPAR